MLSWLRKMLPLTTVLLLAAVAYDGWLFYSRWRAARATEQTIQARKIDADRRTIDMLGGGQLKILNFYASPSSLRPGQHANLCYGVYGATSVKLEPAVEDLHPAVAYCMQVSPSRTTDYQLIATDEAGHTASQKILVRVAP